MTIPPAFSAWCGQVEAHLGCSIPEPEDYPGAFTVHELHDFYVNGDSPIDVARAINDRHGYHNI